MVVVVNERSEKVRPLSQIATANKNNDMSEKYKFSDPEGIYFVTATIVF
jgi:hypothetical protein